ncbi:MAG: hypothetical protein V4628_12245 [Pseudomonadota bacterium]
MDTLQITALATSIVEEIFSVGGEPREFGGPTKRIQFMGTHPTKGHEIPMGGFCYEALLQCVRRVIVDTNLKESLWQQPRTSNEKVREDRVRY